MVDRVRLPPTDRPMVEALLRAQQAAGVDQWTVGRLALARSLQELERPRPDDYLPAAQQRGGVELHANQLIGEGKDGEADVGDLYRALLSAYEGRNLFVGEAEFHEALQRHIRRGLDLIRSEWSEGVPLSRYLLDQLLFDPDHHSSSGAESAETGDRIDRIFGELGIGAEVVETTEGPRLTRYTLQLKSLDDLDRFTRGLSKLAFALGLHEADISHSLAGGQRIYLFIPRPTADWRLVTWGQVKGELRSEAAKAMALPACVGVDVLGAPFLLDIAETPHLFVGGTTGSGKSMCLHALLLSLLAAQEAPDLLLIDPKAVEFTAYERLSRLREGRVITDPDDALAALDRLVGEMTERQTAFNALDARNIVEANARGGAFKRIVAVVDELGDLLMTRREAEAPLIRLAQKARSSGIHLILATQRFEAATFAGLLRSNVPSRIALTVQKSSESRIILDETGAEALKMRGDMLIRLLGRPTLRAHGCRIDQSDILTAVTAS